MKSNVVLDRILTCLNNAYDSYYKSSVIIPNLSEVSFTEIAVDLLNTSVSAAELPIAVDFLEQEHLITKLPKAAGELVGRYKITYKGKLFIENGGYKTQYKRESHKDKIRGLERILLTTGTVFAGIYGLTALKDLFGLKGAFFLPLPYWVALAVLLFGIIAGLIIGLLITELKSSKLSK